MRDTGTQSAVDAADETTDEPRAERPRDDAGDDGRNDAEPDDEERVDTTHLDDVEDGCGCAEVWEHLSDERDE